MNNAMKFTKKPVTIEAVQYTRRFSWPDWFHDAVTRNDVVVFGTGKWASPVEPCYCEIKTLEGTMRAEENDWIICGVKGEIYPCKPDIFDMTYSAALAATEPDTNPLLSNSVDGQESKNLTDKIKPDTEQSAPFGWSSGFAEDFTKDKDIADYWIRKGRLVTPLYTHPAPSQSADQVRDAALVEIALLAEQWSNTHTFDYGAINVLRSFANHVMEIRNSKGAPAATESAELAELRKLAEEALHCNGPSSVIDFVYSKFSEAAGPATVLRLLARLATSSAAKGDA